MPFAGRGSRRPPGVVGPFAPSAMIFAFTHRRCPGDLSSSGRHEDVAVDLQELVVRGLRGVGVVRRCCQVLVSDVATSACTSIPAALEIAPVGVATPTILAPNRGPPRRRAPDVVEPLDGDPRAREVEPFSARRPTPGDFTQRRRVTSRFDPPLQPPIASACRSRRRAACLACIE